MSWLVFVLQYEFYSQLVRFHKKHARIFIAINFHLSISTKKLSRVAIILNLWINLEIVDILTMLNILVFIFS